MPQSPGLPLRLPWVRKQSMTLQPHRGCARPYLTGTTAMRLKLTASVPRVAEAATLGFEALPLRGKRASPFGAKEHRPSGQKSIALRGKEDSREGEPLTQYAGTFELRQRRFWRRQHRLTSHLLF